MVLASLPRQRLYPERQYYYYDDHNDSFPTGVRGMGGGEVSRGRLEGGGRSDGLRGERAGVEGRKGGASREACCRCGFARVIINRISPHPGPALVTLGHISRPRRPPLERVQHPGLRSDAGSAVAP